MLFSLQLANNIVKPVKASNFYFIFDVMKITTIIFDLGNVLIDWNPKYVFDKLFDNEERKRYFFENICTSEWNEMQDA